MVDCKSVGNIRIGLGVLCKTNVQLTYCHFQCFYKTIHEFKNLRSITERKHWVFPVSGINASSDVKCSNSKSCKMQLINLLVHV
jgi:hypothetical protein